MEAPLRPDVPREQYPWRGKDKLAVVLRRGGWTVSTSMVGRILTRLKAQGERDTTHEFWLGGRNDRWRGFLPKAGGEDVLGVALYEGGDVVEGHLDAGQRGLGGVGGDVG